MAFKVTVSKEGYSATSLATEDKDLVFTSDKNTPKIIVSGSTTLTHTGGGGIENTTVTHNRGWAGAMVYANLDGGNRYYFLDAGDGTDSGDNASGWVTLEEDSFTVYIVSSTARTYNIYYFLLQEGASV